MFTLDCTLDKYIQKIGDDFDIISIEFISSVTCAILVRTVNRNQLIKFLVRNGNLENFCEVEYDNFAERTLKVVAGPWGKKVL